MTTVEEFAEARYVDPGDVRVLIEAMVDLHDDDLPDWLINDLDEQLNPWCFRNVPEAWDGRATRDGKLCRCTAMGGREHGRGPDCPPAATP